MRVLMTAMVDSSFSFRQGNFLRPATIFLESIDESVIILIEFAHRLYNVVACADESSSRQLE